MLMVLDGYGIREESHGNAIAAKTSSRCIFCKYPVHHPEASGEFVGLPDGLIGNSEVGHQYRCRKRCAAGPSSHQ